MKKLIFLVLIAITLCSCAEPQESDTNHSDTYSPTPKSTEETRITAEEAVEKALDASFKITSQVNQICTYRGLKSHYPYKITAYEVEEMYNGKYWCVTLKGKVSGYTDDYQTKFTTETFNAFLYVDAKTGFVSSENPI